MVNPHRILLTGSLHNQEQNKIQAVVAIGGGRWSMPGKAVSAMVGKQAPVFDYLEGVGTKTHDGTKIPFIAVPTDGRNR